ncbi:MAG: hypothetical protein WBD87_14865 [Candidatus Acidiferrales bacterium]
MKSKRVPLVAFFMLSGALAPPAAHAQENTGSTITVKSKTLKSPKTKIDTFKGEVVRMNTVSIIVRDPKNSYIVRTFTFSPDLTKKLQNLIERGGYQPGDSVTVRYAHGGSVAQLIKGKASKAY